MPKTLDVLIGLTTVMLLFSLAVAVVTQAVVSTLNLRGRSLLYGMKRLLGQVWPKLDPRCADAIAQFVLRHPAIAVSRSLGAVIQREELVFLLLEAAADESPQVLAEKPKMELRRLLLEDGIAEPAGVLVKLRDLTLTFERLRPDLSAAERKTQAILNAAAGPFTSKLFGWFDQTIDRVSDLFTQRTRIVSLIGATLIVFCFQLDSVWVIQRLSTDAPTRAAVVAEGTGVLDSDEKSGVAAEADPKAAMSREEMLGAANEYAALGLVQTPFGIKPSLWWARWTHLHLVTGSVLSVLLISLGAPFWYDSLKNLVKMKSVLASRDDQQRTERQTTQVPVIGAAAPGIVNPAAIVGVAPVAALDLTEE